MLRSEHGYSAAKSDASSAIFPKRLRCHFIQKYDDKKVRSTKLDSNAGAIQQEIVLHFSGSRLTAVGFLEWSLVVICHGQAGPLSPNQWKIIPHTLLQMRTKGQRTPVGIGFVDGKHATILTCQSNNHIRTGQFLTILL